MLLSKEQKIFSYRLSRARRIVENGFGILVSRFCISEKPIPTSPETVDKIVIACCVLHNWLRKSSGRNYTPSGSLDEEDLDNGFVRLGSWREEINDPLHSVQTVGSNNSSRFARRMR